VPPLDDFFNPNKGVMVSVSHSQMLQPVHCDPKSLKHSAHETHGGVAQTTAHITDSAKHNEYGHQRILPSQLAVCPTVCRVLLQNV